MAAITVCAFAKINLSLRIKNARADGFHEVQTILQAIDLFDRVKCEGRRGPFKIRCNAPGVPTDRTNLVWKAAKHLWTAVRSESVPRDAVVTLEKNIPIRAGLGGGSSDAAAALLGLRRVWRFRVPDEELRAIAAKLGSDVPYFLVGGTALGLGRGEEVFPLPNLPRLWVVLVLPPFGIATRDAYAWLDAQQTRTGLGSLSSTPSYLPDTWLGKTVPLVNDLERAVIERHPAIGTLKDQLREQGAVMSAMSGSGSTVFGVFMTSAAARRAAQRLEHSGADVRYARFRPRKTPGACP